MNKTSIKRYLLSKPDATEDYPFGADVAVFRVNKKMFALLSDHNAMDCINLKCDPEQAFMLRDIFESVIPGYHMNKKHWNTVFLAGDVPPGEIERMIDHSYGLVVKGLPKKVRQALEIKYGAGQLYKA